MSYIKIGSIVAVNSLVGTVERYGYSDNLRRVGDRFTVSDVYETNDAMLIVEDDAGYSYIADEVEVLAGPQYEVGDDIEHGFLMYSEDKVDFEYGKVIDVDTGDTLFPVELQFENGCSEWVEANEMFHPTEQQVRLLALQALKEAGIDDSVSFVSNMENLMVGEGSPQVELQDDGEGDYTITVTTKPQYIITEDSITLTYKGETYTTDDTNANFDEIIDDIINGCYESALSMIDVSAAILKWGQGLLEIENGSVTYNGTIITNKLVDRIINMMGDGDQAFEPFAKCLSLTMEQESFKTRSRIMDFVACGKLDINEDGHVVAFKNVRSDFMDKHSGKFRNQVGDSPSMPRSEVDDDHDNQCSNGLHVCSPTYLKGYWGTSGKTMRVTVDPRDFVAIPYDYNDSKARVCKYTVVEDVSDKINDYL